MLLYQRNAVSDYLGARLHELREARNVSMRALAMQSGLSANALSIFFSSEAKHKQVFF